MSEFSEFLEKFFGEEGEMETLSKDGAVKYSDASKVDVRTTSLIFREPSRLLHIIIKP